MGTHSLHMSKEPERLEYVFKILLVGPRCAGKKSIAHRYTENKFSETYKCTIGMDFLQKRVHWEKNIDVVLQLWDIGGQLQFTNMTTHYYRGAHGCIVVFDTTEKDSFEGAKIWKRDVDAKLSYNDKPIPSILFANKVDLGRAAFLSDEVLEEFSQENQFSGWYETSAKDDRGIDFGMMQLIKQIITNLEVQEKPNDNIVRVMDPSPRPESNGPGCC